METLWQDLRYGFRMLARNPGFTAVAVLTLALGIGANTTIFSVVNAVLLRPLPYPEPDHLVFLNEHPQGRKEMDFSVSLPAFEDWSAQNRVFERLACFRGDSFNLTGHGQPERIRGLMVSGTFFSTIGVAPVLGRTFTPKDDRPGAAPTVVLSHRLWQRRFAGDPGIVGQLLMFNARAFTVIGVMPPNFGFVSRNAEMWAPIGLFRRQLSYGRDNHPGLWAVGRMKPGVTLDQARSDMDRIARSIEQETGFRGGVTVTALKDRVVGSSRPALLALLGAVGFVLLIACANVANLLLVRAAAREKEIAIRTALGASRGRVLRQLLTESVLLSLLGAAGGTLLAAWGVDLLLVVLPPSTPRLNEIGMDGDVFLFTLLVAPVVGVLFGLAPALQTSKPDLHSALKEGGRTSKVGSRHRLRSLLVVSEIALSLLLLISAGLMFGSFFRLAKVDPGFTTEHTLTMRFSLPASKYPTAREALRFYNRLLEKVEALPRVKFASVSSAVPLAYGGNENGFVREGIEPGVDNFTLGQENIVSREYFRTLGIPLLRGRTFTKQDNQNAPVVTVVDETLVERIFPGEDPLGKRLNFGYAEDPQWAEIVGVVRHARSYELRSNGLVQFYIHLPQMPAWQSGVQDMSLTVRAGGDPLSLIPAIKTQVKELDPDQPVFGVMTLTEAVDSELAGQRLYFYLFGFFAAAALLLAAVGIYGVISYSVSRRTHELGIRMALGAQPRDIFKLVVGQGMVLTLAGVGVGLAGAFALTRFLESLLFGVSATDPVTFAGVAVLLAAVALLACYIPARRATRVDPLVALRYE